jgi:hypothetical protein
MNKTILFNRPVNMPDLWLCHSLFWRASPLKQLILYYFPVFFTSLSALFYCRRSINTKTGKQCFLATAGISLPILKPGEKFNKIILYHFMVN